MDATDQKKWEREMIALGISRYRANEATAKEQGNFISTSSGARLIEVFLSQVSAEIAVRVDGPVPRGGRSMYLKLLKGIDYDKLAMFTLHRVVECVYKPASLQKVASSIGKMVEDELRFSKFEIETPEFYNAVIRDLDNRKSNQYRHRHRVLVSRMNDREVDWNSWNNETHMGVGLLLLSAAEASSDLIVRSRKGGNTVVEPSPDVIEWITKHDESIEIMLPDRMPCLIEPQPWTGWKDGGFYTSRLQTLTPLVKTRSGQHRDTQAPLLDTCAMPVLYDSVNAMQGTSWAINQPVLDVVREIWDRGLEIGMPRSQPYEIPQAPVPDGKKPGDLHGAEKERFLQWKNEARTLHGLEGDRKAALMGVVRAMRMAAKMDHLELLWMVYQLDFRSRGYTTTSGVSPQGSDVSKAMLHFGKGEKLGQRGWYWFQVHGANKYGYDKEHYDTRVSWVQDRAEQIIAAGTDPLAHADVWKTADKPFQFLAWCMEYAACSRCAGGPQEFVSRLPIALDGSCNGLQHFSAMLRDPVGGASVNLIPADKPSDIYQDVADVATEKLRDITTQPGHELYAYACNWLALFKSLGTDGMGRKLSKKPVMTLPYGSTLQTCTQSVHGWYLEQKVDFFPEGTGFSHSLMLSQLLWRSIGEVVIAARAAMDWLQKAARILAKHDEPIIFTSPIGFPMVQFTPNMDTKRIEAQIGGRVQVQIKKEMPGVSGHKAATGSAPNLVHCVDATHLHMVVAACKALGITHFAMIHDDFGVHACHVDTLHRVIREEFISLHSVDLLAEFKRQQEERTGIELPELPTMGTLDIHDVAKSLFFFG